MGIRWSVTPCSSNEVRALCERPVGRSSEGSFLEAIAGKRGLKQFVVDEKTGYGYHFPVDVSVRDARSGMVLYTRCLSTIHLMHLSKLALRRMLMGLKVYDIVPTHLRKALESSPHISYEQNDPASMFAIEDKAMHNYLTLCVPEKDVRTTVFVDYDWKCFAKLGGSYARQARRGVASFNRGDVFEMVLVFHIWATLSRNTDEISALTRNILWCAPTFATDPDEGTAMSPG